MSLLKRDHGIDADEVEVLADEPDAPPAVDATCRLRSGHVLRMQVTRALPTDVKAEWARDRAVDVTHELDDSVSMLFTAIDNKTEHYRAKGIDLSNLTLLVDGMEAPQLALPTPTFFEPTHGDWARTLGWESIWVVGSLCAKRLDWVQDLPTNWTHTARTFSSVVLESCKSLYNCLRSLFLFQPWDRR